MRRISFITTSAVISFLLIIPFVILELVNRRNYNEAFPVMLFGVLWFLTALFIILLMPVLQASSKKEKSLSLQFLSRAAALIVIGCLLAAILVDQMPCFVGVGNCD